VESLLHYILFMSPYRCDECDERHFRFRLAKHVQRPWKLANTEGFLRGSCYVQKCH
jgi:hypothetical protein